VPSEDGTPRQGVRLYEAILFGDFGENIPQAFVREVYA
jgi:hypothetical protein